MQAPLALLMLTLTLHCCVANSPRVWGRDEIGTVSAPAEGASESGSGPAGEPRADIGVTAQARAQGEPATGGRSAERPANAPTAARASQIAAGLVDPLRALEAALEPWRACLARPGCDAGRFLDGTESALLGILEAPELAGLRDWVREEFRELRRAEGLPVEPDAFPAAAFARRGAIRRAALRQAAGDGLFERVLAIVRRPGELAQHNDLLTSLCVRSRPVQGAQFSFWPSSEPDAVESGVSANSVPIYRGRYAYKVVPRATYQTIRCDPTGGQGGCSRVDLMKDNRPVFECDLESGFCDRRADPGGGCRGGA